jgi:hypothetical protein
VFLTFEDEDFDVSIIVVATEGEESNALKKTLPASAKEKHTVGETYLHSKSLYALQL